MKVADAVAERALCSRRRVGAVITDANNRVAATGYAGPPAGLEETRRCREWCPRFIAGETGTDYSTCLTVHAEMNALAYVDRSRVEGGTIYVTGSVCMDCAKVIANSGLATVIMRVVIDEAYRRPADVIDLLRSCGLEVFVWKEYR